MIILSNCFTEILDEGCLKVANSLIGRIKRADPAATLVSYGDETPLSDRHFRINKLMLSLGLARLLRRKKEAVLYLPFPAPMLPTSIRVFVLSLFARWGCRVILVLRSEMGALARLLMRLSRAEIIVLSADSRDYYRETIGAKCTYLKTGVDTGRFCPVPAEEKRALRIRYALPEDKPIVLHVGHMKSGRNLSQLLNIDERFHVLLVVSTRMQDEQDARLRAQLEAKKNITIIDTYVPQIEQLYQLSDVYLFPVTEECNCIDVPLSALEAAACGLSVAATPYGELKQLLDCDGFYPVTDFSPEGLNAVLERAYRDGGNARAAVLDYDWNIAVEALLK